MTKLWEVLGAVADAAEMLEHASRLAMDASGAAEDPKDEGWPAMAALCAALDRLAGEVKASVPAEIVAAKGAEDAEMDRYDVSPY